MAKKPFRLVAIYYKKIPDLGNGYEPIDEWSCFVKQEPNKLIFESTRSDYLESVAYTLDEAAQPKFLSIQIEYLGKYAKPYKD